MAYCQYKRLKQQYSPDGIVWLNTDPPIYKKGELVNCGLEECSEDKSSEEGGGGSGYPTQIERWVTIPGDFICNNGNKYYKLALQFSRDNGKSWSYVLPMETKIGELWESESADCEIEDVESWEVVEDEYICEYYDDTPDPGDYPDPEPEEGYNFAGTSYKGDTDIEIVNWQYMNSIRQPSITNTPNIRQTVHVRTDGTFNVNLRPEICETDPYPTGWMNMLGIPDIMGFNFQFIRTITKLPKFSNFTNFSYFFCGSLGTDRADRNYFEYIEPAALMNMDMRNAENMSYMFMNQPKWLKPLDVSFWDVRKAYDFTRMFSWGYHISEIKLWPYNFEEVTADEITMFKMFAGTILLDVLDLSVWDFSNYQGKVNMVNMFWESSRIFNFESSTHARIIKLPRGLKRSHFYDPTFERYGNTYSSESAHQTGVNNNMTGSARELFSFLNDNFRPLYLEKIYCTRDTYDYLKECSSLYSISNADWIIMDDLSYWEFYD